MSWVAVGGAAAGAVVGGVMNSGSNSGGGGTQTVSKDPWAPAQPWLTSLLGQGQNLQGQYAAQPFNPLQQGAYSNLIGGNDYINQMVPGLLAQMSQPTGFDRSNPRARPQPFHFPAMQGATTPLAGTLAPSMAQAQAVPAPAAAAPQPTYQQGLMGVAPVGMQIPGTTSPAPLPTTWEQWVNGGLGANGGY